MSDQILKQSFRGGLTFEGTNFGRCALEIEYHREENYLFYTCGPVDLSEELFFAVQRLCIQGNGIIGARFLDNEDFYGVILDYCLPFDESGPKEIPLAVPRVLGDSDKSCLAVVKLMEAVKNNPTSIDSGLLKIQRDHYVERFGFDPREIPNYSLFMIRGCYLDEPLPIAYIHNHIVLLPSWLKRICDEGADPNFKELKALSQLTYPLSKIRYVLTAENDEDYKHLIEVAQSMDNPPFPAHEMPSYPYEPAPSIFVLEKGLPISSFSMRLYDGAEEGEFDTRPSFARTVADATYERYLELENILPGDSRIIKEFLGKTFY